MRALLTFVVTAVTFASAGVYAAFVFTALRASRRFLRHDDPRRRVPPSAKLPGVSILKPCAGADDALEACLASFCKLAYPNVEILCGVSDEHDGAVPILQRVRAQFPDANLSIVLTSAGASVNPKVAQLEVLVQHARHDIVWISDSNTSVHPDTLASMVSDLSRKNVGLVTSPIVGIGEKSFGTALENAQLAAFVTMSTLALFRLTGRVFAPGKSALLRRTTLEAIGGFDELGRYCAEDHVLVERVRARGERVVLGRHLVANVNASGDVARFVARHRRWTQLHWRLVPAGALLEVMLFPLLIALVSFALIPSSATASVLVACTALQIVGDVSMLRALRGRALRTRHAIATVVRPLLFAGLWFRAGLSRRVEWRGHERWLGRDTLLLERNESRRGRLVPRLAVE
jgi:ceramide glucosyltransferase